ncbi:hypothetical protein KEM56_001606 [Ascosphaera pollenicola]|nr:hypothetical protein KEM56_001606 [Ascosphaera pollenicola]
MLAPTTATTSDSRPTSKDGVKRNLWSSMLDGVASAKRLPEKNLLVLGGNPDSQREFLETLSPDSSDPRVQRKGKAPPFSNQFALGYTYQDVLDADHEDTLARLSIYLLSEPSTSFAPLLKPLLTPTSIPQTLIVILLDWEQPWSWARELREWIRLLRLVMISLDDETKIVMEEVMTDWRDHRRVNGSNDSSVATGGSTSNGTTGVGNVNIPLGPGEWDEGLGVPLCVVCQGADNIEKLEKEHGWREEEFDYILQFMRTILLKHKDKILVPSNWDSWGKIRIIREGFDMEGIGTAWSIEIQDRPTPFEGLAASNSQPDEWRQQQQRQEACAADGTSAVYIYEQMIQNPKRSLNSALSTTTQKPEAPKIEVETRNMQDFLTDQLQVLERLKAEDEARDRQLRKMDPVKDFVMPKPVDETAARVNEHIGPVQFNMGGIQVDAEDMLRKLKEREANRTPIRRDTLGTPPQPSSSGSPSSSHHQGGSNIDDGKMQNQALASFFAGLVKKPGGGSRTPAGTS